MCIAVCHVVLFVLVGLRIFLVLRYKLLGVHVGLRASIDSIRQLAGILAE